jgi:hypothetical protein
MAEHDDSLGIQIREFEYRLAEEKSMLDDSHVQYYRNQQTKLRNYLSLYA